MELEESKIKGVKELITDFLKQEQIAYNTFEENSMEVAKGTELFMIDLSKVEMNVAVTAVNDVMKKGNTIFMINCLNPEITGQVIGIELVNEFIAIKKHGLDTYLYIMDSLKYRNQIIGTNRKSTSVLAMESMENYRSRQREILQSIVLDCVALDSLDYEQNEEEVTSGSIYVILKENFQVDRKQQVDNEIVFKITRELNKKSNTDRIGISTDGTCFSPTKETRIMSDDEVDRGYFQNRIQVGIQSQGAIPRVGERIDTKPVTGFDNYLFKTSDKIIWEYQMKQSVEGIICLYQNEISSGHPLIAPLPHKSKKYLEVSGAIFWEKSQVYSDRVELSLQWSQELYACRIPITSKYWFKKVMIENKIEIAIHLDRIGIVP